MIKTANGSHHTLTQTSCIKISHFTSRLPSNEKKTMSASFTAPAATTMAVMSLKRYYSYIKISAVANMTGT